MEANVDQDTATAAVDGDADALRRILEACGPRLRRHFTSRIARRYQAVLDVEDVLQVTYMEAFLRMREFRPTGADGFYPWLLRIADNNLVDAIRELDAAKRPDRRKQIDVVDSGDSYATFLATVAASGTTPTRHATREEAVRILESTLADLPPDYATAVRLWDLEERDIEEVCNAYDPPKSAGAVHMMRMRARDCLRVLLGEPGRFFSTGS